ncbi:restriction endonuclease [Halalkalibacter flavus]|uniref:restriction endonuclease n=1 Tax=Halalkalibacter flavus TaxID=3090668 RepID=UPI002FCA2FEC
MGLEILIIAAIIYLICVLSIYGFQELKNLRGKRRNKPKIFVYSIMWIALFISYFSSENKGYSVMILTLILVVMLISTFYGIIKDNKRLEELRLLKLKRLRESGIHEIDQMDGYEFERYLKELFKSRGYSVIKTPNSGDFGADVLIEKDGFKIAIQAKRYQGNVGIKAVQEIQSAMLYYKSDEAWVITNSNYTKSAKELAEKTGVRLVNREKLATLILDTYPNKSVKEVN